MFWYFRLWLAHLLATVAAAQGPLLPASSSCLLCQLLVVYKIVNVVCTCTHVYPFHECGLYVYIPFMNVVYTCTLYIPFTNVDCRDMSYMEQTRLNKSPKLPLGISIVYKQNFSIAMFTSRILASPCTVLLSQRKWPVHTGIGWTQPAVDGCRTRTVCVPF